MNFKYLTRFVSLLLVVALGACGDGSFELGNFPNINKIEGDPAFALTAPASSSSGAFSYTSSDPAVATIAGNMVTIAGVGTTTITAHQAAYKSYGSNSTTAVLTVSARTCTAPATPVKGICTAPAATGNFVKRSGRTWMPVMSIANWTDAKAYCTTTTINGETGWSMPTEFDLTDLHTSGAMRDQGWILSNAWSSTAGSTAATRKVVNLDDGKVANEAEAGSAYIACVK